MTTQTVRPRFNSSARTMSTGPSLAGVDEGPPPSPTGTARSPTQSQSQSTSASFVALQNAMNMNMNGGGGMPMSMTVNVNVNMTPSRGAARKQAQAEKSRVRELSKSLMTRLQYASFKVEHGWTKQSLSEVENLYYRHRQGQGSMPGVGVPPSSTGTSLFSPISTGPSSGIPPRTPTPAVSSNNRLRKPESMSDVFGVTTPPQSAGALPHTGEENLFGTQDRLGTSFGMPTPRSPNVPRPCSFSNTNGRPAPMLGQSGHGCTVSTSPGKSFTSHPSSTASAPAGPPSTSANGAKGVTSYADFWSRVGSSGAGAPGPVSVPAPGNTAGRQGTSPPLHSSDAASASASASASARRSSLIGTKRSADSQDSTESSPFIAGNSSPLKRVRMAQDERRTHSPSWAGPGPGQGTQGTMDGQPETLAAATAGGKSAQGPPSRQPGGGTHSPFFDRGPSFAAAGRRTASPATVVVLTSAPASASSMSGTTTSAGTGTGTGTAHKGSRLPRLPREGSPTPTGRSGGGMLG